MSRLPHRIFSDLTLQKSRMAPGGRLASESPVRRFQYMGIERPQGTAPTQYNSLFHFMVNGTDDVMPPTTWQLFDPDEIALIDRTGDLVEFVWWSARRLSDFSMPDGWEILDYNWLYLGQNDWFIDGTSTWEWGIAMHTSRHGDPPPEYTLSFATDDAPGESPSVWEVDAHHVMFRGMEGGSWRVQRAGDGENTATVTFAPYPSDMLFRLTIILTRGFYRGWQEPIPPLLPPTWAPGLGAGLTAADASPYPVADSQKHWGSSEYTKELFQDAPSITGTYLHDTSGVSGAPAWQLLHLGWTP